MHTEVGETAGRITAASAPAPALRRAEALVKRAFDISFALVALVVTAPVLLAAVVAVKLDSPGPVFFRQPRMGKDGRIFTLVKLRGMYVDAEDRFPELYAYREAMNGDGPYYFHRDDDPRVTRVGRFTRRFSIDELPNFWNVLVGDMSVVGPRPEIPELAPLYGDSLERILSVRPGVTSPAKARGRDALSFADTLASDLEYLERRTFRLDLATIGHTAVNVVRARGVRS